MIPTETELNRFEKLYLIKHFSNTAINIGITQPTLTQSIAKLEDKLSVILFYRTKQGCIPTKAADIFYEKTLQYKSFWHETKRDIGQLDSQFSGSYRLGCHQSVGSYILPGFLEEIYKVAPGIHLKLEHALSREITEKIISYKLDFGFVVNPVKHPDLVHIKLGNDKVCFWKNNKKLSNRTIFADLNLIQSQTLLSKKTLNKFKDWKIIETSSLELIRTLTSKGNGIGILPERLAKAEGYSLKLFDSNLPFFNDEIYLVFRVDALKSLQRQIIIDSAKLSLKAF